ncbi:EAL domain-containing protein [Cupriavidus basilensis]|uniref:EAL domain-containing protein n=1 Tax=Cupriavidus basilensis TaxID=68895 RepID=A0ABT6AGG2_9BURK|nr:EAL domain-containing protein [Cupriavidus basilensis]MDF3831690.1 EAL domain-containing protein [Cupriavidus basilensis]
MTHNQGPPAEAELFRTLVLGVADYAIYALDPSGSVSSWNAGAQRIKGYTQDEILGAHFSCFYTAEDRAAGQPEQALLQARELGRFEAAGCWRVRKDGTRFWAHVLITPLYGMGGMDGGLIGYAKVTRDMTQQQADAERLAEVTRKLDLALENMSQGLCLFDPAGTIILTNGRMDEIFGGAGKTLAPGADFFGLCRTMAGVLENEAAAPGAQAGREYGDANPEPGQPDGRAGQYAVALYERHREILRRHRNWRSVEVLPDGRAIALSHSAMADGSWVTTCEDVTEQRRIEAKIQHMACHDGLTGLPNRNYFNDYLDEELLRAQKLGCQVATLGIDLDRFKEINDLHGHAAGDTVLKSVSARIAGQLEPGEFIARIGGDEFIAVKRFERQAELSDFSARLVTCLSEPVRLDGFDLTTGASIGIAIFPGDGERRDQLVSNTDLAMYRAKGSLSESICFYESRMDEAERARRALAGELWTAIAANQFVLDYQVQTTIATGEAIGCEALLRWLHPERGLIAPDNFIPLAEECGAILPIGEWVLRTACQEAAQWTYPHKVSVNLSPVQITHGDLVTVVARVLEETGLAAGRLELEITESTIIGDKERALDILRRIKALGVSIAIDDFGTGYSSLDTLRSFPFDKIKLDRTFIAEIAGSQQAKAIIRAILALGQSLAIPVLAEGVETDEQLNLLHAEGCDEAQGFLLGRPQPLAYFRRTHAAPGPRPAAAASLA